MCAAKGWASGGDLALLHWFLSVAAQVAVGQNVRECSFSTIHLGRWLKWKLVVQYIVMMLGRLKQKVSSVSIHFEACLHASVCTVLLATMYMSLFCVCTCTLLFVLSCSSSSM